MREVTLHVEERKYDFFMELIKNLDFIKIPVKETTKKQTLKQIAQGMQAALLAGEGKIKSRSAKSFLNEL